MKVPKIRFKGFGGDWMKRKLGDSVLLNRYKQISAEELQKLNEYHWDIALLPSSKNYDRKCNFYESLSNLINDAEIITVWRARNANTKYYKWKFIASQNHIIESFNNNEVNTKFLYLFILQHDKEFYSAESTYPMFTKQDFNDINLYYPNKQEQEKIWSLFEQLDSQITKNQQKLEKLKNLKQSFLQKLFPKAWATVPELRFKGFEGVWEERKFSEITFLTWEKNKDNLPLESYSISNEKWFIPQKEQFENWWNMADADKRMYYIVWPQSFVYNPARINVWSIGYSNLSKNVIVSSLYEVFQTINNINDVFLWHWFKWDSFPKMIEKLQEWGVRLYFYYDKLCLCSISLPSLPEQEKIWAFFEKLDTQITQQTQKLEKLKNIKQSLLEKMFI